ncbi:MAG TPA: DUF4233 domain-containing protein [Propionibacteriaceae bacterium]|nr:DUF4233 domain-containing protein [Propionibacteriaceae bacterium]HPZ50429.1 DUF4233 domain-containing protein [Propionibacteriaceae bacterium]
MTLPAGNPMTMPLVSLLAIQAVVFLLAIPGMIMVSEVAAPVAFTAGGIAALVAIAACAMLRRGTVGYALGWLTQPIGVLLGLLTPAMFFLGGLFALLWVITFVLGRRLAERTVSRPG